MTSKKIKLWKSIKKILTNTKTEETQSYVETPKIPIEPNDTPQVVNTSSELTHNETQDNYIGDGGLLDKLLIERMAIDHVERKILGSRYIIFENASVLDSKYSITQQAQQYVGYDEYNRMVEAEVARLLKEHPIDSNGPRLVCRWR